MLCEVAKLSLSTRKSIAGPLENVVFSSLLLNPGAEAVRTCFQVQSYSFKICDCRGRVGIIRGRDRISYDLHKSGTM